MRLVRSKTVVAVALAALLLVAAAAPIFAHDGHARPHKTDPAKVAARLADTYGIDQAAIKARLDSGTSLRDIGRAAFLAKASGKTFDEVLALKKSDNSWKDVANALGVTKDQAKATRRALAADRLSAKLGFDRGTVLGLLEQGYKTRDIAMAGLLAENTGKTPASILDMKKINNTWRDVAGSLGVSDDTLKQDMQKLRQAYGGHHRSGK
jgi:hypothetical protein